MKNRWTRNVLVAAVIMTIGACSTTRDYNFKPKPLALSRDKSASADTGSNKGEQTNDGSANKRVTRQVPQPPGGSETTTALSFEQAMSLEGANIAINVASLPLPEFINEVFGNQLGLSYHLDPRLEDKKDLVTLNIENPLSPKDLYRTVQTVLTAYGVALRNDNGLIRVEFSPAGESTEPPILVSGRALPTVPATHRPVFYLMDMNVVQAQRAVGWLAQAFEGQKVKFSSDPERNAVWIRGSLDVVKQAVEVVKLVDQPLMRGRYSIRVEPRYLGADKLAVRLMEMLQAQGYYASIGKPGAISLFTIEETNSIIVFANDQNALDYVEEWVEELDKPLKQTKGDSVFYYEVKNTSAQDVADAINQLRTGGAGIGAGAGAAANAATGGAAGASPAAATGAAGNRRGGGSTAERGQLVVDLGRNALLFYGSNEEWVTMLPAIEKLDQRPLQVLIEVIVAEVTLSDSFSFGIDWAINNVGSDLFDGATPDSIAISNGGLTLFPISSSGYTRAVLQLLATDSRVNILQTPRVLVKSGQEATINVGNDVPIIGSSQSSQEGNTIAQAIQYRKTGNTLSVKPVIYAGGEVDLELTQELSSSIPDPNNATGSPTIFTRRISTALSIEDGGSVLVGGLIDTSENEGENRVPILGDLPLIGQLFTSTAKSTSRTELMILIAPYVVGTTNDAKAVTEAFKKRLTLIPD